VINRGNILITALLSILNVTCTTEAGVCESRQHGQRDPAALYNEALRLEKASRWDDAADKFRAVTELSPSNALAWSHLGSMR
jgi:outer membrane protein assembly factor BamD (BamD/ComL family)